ncbi:unnamed protein product, partial [Discosporangium mesarthrocarpum]
MADAVGMKGHIISLTTDTAAYIKKAIMDWIRCAAHVMGRSVQWYVSQKELKATIDTFNKAVTHIHCSTASQEHLKRAQKNNSKPLKKIPLWCKTRWWSSYNMLTTLLEYRYEVMSTTEPANKRPNGPHTVIKDNDWDNAKSMCDMLEPFAQAVEPIEGDKYITLSFIPLLMSGLNAAILQAASNATDQDGAASVASDALFDDHTDRWEELTDATRDIAAEQAQAAIAQVSGEAPTGPAASSHDADSKKKGRASLMGFVKRVRGSRRAEGGAGQGGGSAAGTFAAVLPSSTTAAQGGGSAPAAALTAEQRMAMVAAEITRFRATTGLQLEGSGDDALAWWVKNQDGFPYLAQLAVTHLAIPATSATSERVFRLQETLLPTNATVWEVSCLTRLSS